MCFCTFHDVNCLIFSWAEGVLNYLQVSGDDVVTRAIIKSLVSSESVFKKQVERWKDLWTEPGYACGYYFKI